MVMLMSRNHHHTSRCKPTTTQVWVAPPITAPHFRKVDIFTPCNSITKMTFKKLSDLDVGRRPKLKSESFSEVSFYMVR